MIVVSDASPLIALSVVGRLDLLRLLYGRVLIPEAVRRETEAVGPEAPGAPELVAAIWIETRAVVDTTFVESLGSDLDRGEAAAIALALECEADLLLMDERRGRRTAARFGRRVVGVLGVLIEAKGKGCLTAVKPVLDSLMTDAGFRVGDELYDAVLRAAGESRSD